MRSRQAASCTTAWQSAAACLRATAGPEAYSGRGRHRRPHLHLHLHLHPRRRPQCHPRRRPHPRRHRRHGRRRRSLRSCRNRRLPHPSRRPFHATMMHSAQAQATTAAHPTSSGNRRLAVMVMCQSAQVTAAWVLAKANIAAAPPQHHHRRPCLRLSRSRPPLSLEAALCR